MATLPTGTVTFLFTDIEGSTKLAQQYPESMPALLARHNEILNRAIETHNGFIFQVVGDSYAVSFHNADDALNAALDAQRDLHNENWTPAPIKVRMGIHTGAAQLQIDSKENPYAGYATLALTQRIMSAGHGGQILLSQTTHDLTRDRLPEKAHLIDMGEKNLKDILRPERIYQLSVPDLPSEFAPLKTLEKINTNLPAQLTTFIGRGKEVGQIKKRLEKNRLVTLTGSGGIGKTRLSIQVSSELLNEYPNGVWLVELAPLTDPALVTQTVCAALDVTPQGNTSALKVLTDYLREKKILLVMDNCEHLIDACAQLCDSLLHACPNLHIIASSREALGIEGENAYRVPSLSLPDSHGGLSVIEESESVKLFMERANAILPEFELTESNASSVAQICQRLDGIALAIELGASRVKILKVEQIAARLDDAFRLLTGGSRTALPRQQTLRALIDWSYNLLSDEERIVLRRLSVFMGGWTLEAAEAVCGNAEVLDVLTHLIDKSLVAVDREHGDEARYYLLETIRQYAREKLAESGEGEQSRARHLDYFLKFAQKAEPELYGAGQIEWGQKLENEYENMRSAMEWSLQADVTTGQQLAAALWWGWDRNGHLSEGYEWLGRMLAADTGGETLTRARLLSGRGWQANILGYREIGKKLSEESVALFRKLGDEAGLAFPLGTLGINAYRQSDYDLATRLFEESLDLFKRAGNKWGVRHIMGALGYTAEAQGNLAQARKLYEESLALCKEIGDIEGVGWTLYLMGNLAVILGEHGRAMELYEEALQIEKKVNSHSVIAWLLNTIGNLSIQNGDYERAVLLFGEAKEINQKRGDQASIADSIEGLGMVAYYRGDFPKAQSYYSESLTLFHRIGNKMGIADCLVCIGNLMGAQGSFEKFARILGMAEAFVPDIQKWVWFFIRAETGQFIESVRAALGDDAYTAAYNAGHQMSLDEAIAYTLKELG